MKYAYDDDLEFDYEDFEAFEKFKHRSNRIPGASNRTKRTKHDEYQSKRRESAQRRQELINSFENEFSN